MANRLREMFEDEQILAQDMDCVNTSKTCDTCKYKNHYSSRLYSPCCECEVTKRERAEFFDTLEEKLEKARNQFEACDKCKREFRDKLVSIRTKLDYEESEARCYPNWEYAKGLNRARTIIEEYIEELQ